MIFFGQKLYVSAAIVATFLGVLLHKIAFVTGSPECSDYDFPCEDGGCIDSGLWCDSTEDCDDGSDEKYCRKSGFFENFIDPNRCSPLFYFKCNDGSCIPLIGRCNGIENCEDSSDEKNCAYYNAKNRTPEREFEGFNAAKFFVSLNSSNNSIHMKTFSGRESSDFTNQRIKARNWLYSQRRKDFGWGDETHRAVTALCLSNEPPIGAVGESLVLKQLEIQLFRELLRNGTKPVKLTDLALYINALLAICKDPKNFYGENLVRVLRERVNAAHMEDTFVNPSVYLSLCINNATTYDDARKLQNIFLNRNDTIGIVEIQSLALMVSACIFQKTDFLNSSVYDSLKMEFLRTVKIHAVSGNVYEAALLIQALQEIKVTIEGVTDFILKQQQANGSFGDVLSTYLVMPILAGKNMLQIHDHCVQRNLSDFPPSQVVNEKSKKMHVHYSLNYGFTSDIKQTIQMHVPEGTNFLDVMKLAQQFNPKYKFKLGESREVPIVYYIGGISNDAEKGLYWMLYKTSRNSSEIANEKHWDPYSGDIKKLILADGDKVLFWYRPLQT